MNPDRPARYADTVMGYCVAPVGATGSDRCIGTVVEWDAGLVTIAPLGPETQRTFADHLFVRPVLAQKKDKTMILEGELAGQTGMVIGIDGNDAIVKMHQNLDIRILKREWCSLLP
jgi:hypothetical protein